MARQQIYRGNPEVKQTILFDNFSGGMNTTSIDDQMATNEFRMLENVELIEQGRLQKRKGFGRLNKLLSGTKLATAKNIYYFNADKELDKDDVTLEVIYESSLDGLNYTVFNIKGEEVVTNNVFPIKHKIEGKFKKPLITGVPVMNYSGYKYVLTTHILEDRFDIIKFGKDLDNKFIFEILNKDNSFKPNPYDIGIYGEGFNLFSNEPHKHISNQKSVISSIQGVVLTDYEDDSKILTEFPNNGTAKMLVYYTGSTLDPSKLKMNFYVYDNEDKKLFTNIRYNYITKNEDLGYAEFEINVDALEPGELLVDIYISVDLEAPENVIDLEINNVNDLIINYSNKPEEFYLYNEHTNTLTKYEKNKNTIYEYNITTHPVFDRMETITYKGVIYAKLYTETPERFDFNNRVQEVYVKKDGGIRRYNTAIFENKKVITSKTFSKYEMIDEGETGRYSEWDLTDDALNNGIYIPLGLNIFPKYYIDGLPFKDIYSNDVDIKEGPPETITKAGIKIQYPNERKYVETISKWFKKYDVYNIPVKVSRAVYDEAYFEYNMIVTGDSKLIDNFEEVDIVSSEKIYKVGEDYYVWNVGSNTNTEMDFIKKTELDIPKEEIILNHTTMFEITNKTNPSFDEIGKLDFIDSNGTIVGDRMVLFKENTIWWSSVYSELEDISGTPQDFTYFPNNNWASIPLEMGDSIQAIRYYRGSYMIFTKKSIYRMSGDFNPDLFEIQMVSDAVGCVAPNSIRSFNNTLQFLSEDGLYIMKQNYYMDGMENVEKVDKLISDIVTLGDHESLMYNEQYWLLVKDEEGNYSRTIKQYYNMVSSNKKHPFTIDTLMGDIDYIFKIGTELYSIKFEDTELSTNQIYEYSKIINEDKTFTADEFNNISNLKLAEIINASEEKFEGYQNIYGTLNLYNKNIDEPKIKLLNTNFNSLQHLIGQGAHIIVNDVIVAENGIPTSEYTLDEESSKVVLKYGDVWTIEFYINRVIYWGNFEEVYDVKFILNKEYVNNVQLKIIDETKPIILNYGDIVNLDVDPVIYKYNTNYTDFGIPYTTVIETPHWSLGYPLHEKKFKNLFVNLESEDRVPIKFLMSFDKLDTSDEFLYEPFVNRYGEIEYRRSRNPKYVLETTGRLVLNKGYLDLDRLGDSKYQVHKINPSSKGRYIKFYIENNEDSLFAIDSISIVYKLGKMRERR